MSAVAVALLERREPKMTPGVVIVFDNSVRRPNNDVEPEFDCVDDIHSYCIAKLYESGW
ncbi:MAG TPA: hypothetical protein VJG64_01075 [Candidatus Paceibacterota bacterium]